MFRPLYTLIIMACCSSFINVVNASSSDIAKNVPVFNIVSKIYVDGELVSTPHFVIRANQKATINFSNNENSSNLKMRLVANNTTKSSDGKDAIKIAFDVQYKNKHENISAKPEVIVLPKQKTAITLTSKSGHLFKIWVTAVRQLS